MAPLSGLLVVSLEQAVAAPTASRDAHAAHDHSVDNPESPTVWTCSMHPQIQLSEPGSCPICGMDLIPVAASGGDTLAANEVQLTERARALARVRTARVERLQEAGVGARLLGRVEPDERRLSTVTTWIGGRIDRLHLRVTGERVRRGQTIATLYSPEVYSAHQDLLAAKRQLTRLAQASPETRSAAEAALESTRERLRLLGIPDSALASMEGAARPQRQVSIRSPFAGTVMARSATEGMYVQAGAALYQVADLSRVWVQLEAYERDLAGLALGQHVTLTFEAVPAREFEGTIAFIEPMVDARRRIARVRVELDNPAGVLRPGMFAQARIDALGAEDGEAPLVIPASAALFTGRRSVVYVESAHDEGTNARYAATVVRLGAPQGDR